MKRSFFVTLVITFILVLTGIPHAQREKISGEPIVTCLIELEHADAEHLASILQPFLSPAGKIIPYPPTNTLIIKDKESIVKMLSAVIKGRRYTPIFQPSEPQNSIEKKETHLDR